MQPVFIIADNEQAAALLEKRCEAITSSPIEQYVRTPPITTDPNQMIPYEFSRVTDWLEGSIGGDLGVIRNALAVVSLPPLRDQSRLLDQVLDPIRSLNQWGSVISMLVLAFPEIHWVFDTPYEMRFPKVHGLDQNRSLRTVAALRHAGFSPLFDPTGLRDGIRRQIGVQDTALFAVPRRDSCAAAIDEEQDYSLFLGYYAYRTRMRAHVVTTLQMMQQLFGTDEGWFGNCNLNLVFEDVQLNFADKGDLDELSNVRERDQQFPFLLSIPKRLFVTSGTKGGDLGKYCQELRQGVVAGQPQDVDVLSKHIPGLFGLQKMVGIESECDMQLQARDNPPHSATGRLLMIADSLTRRAARMQYNTDEISSLLQGATLALDAIELLAWSTPTTAIKALKLQHRLEVSAECSFAGVRYELKVPERFAEIEDTLAEKIAVHMEKRNREEATLNAKSGLLDSLVMIFRDFNQFDEELASLREVWTVRIREKRRVAKSKSWWRPGRWLQLLVCVIGSYVSVLLYSFRWFMLSCSVWIVLLAALLALTGPAGLSFLDWISFSALTFVGLGIPDSSLTLGTGTPIDKSSFAGLLLLEMVVGYVHLGIFISALYQRLSRR